MTTSSDRSCLPDDPDDVASPGGLTVAPTQPRSGLLLVRVIGEVDMLTARRLGDVLHGAVATVADDRDTGAAPPDETPSVVCDLNGVTFFGASGLDAFANAHDEAVRRAVQIVVVAGCRAVRRPFRLTALDRRILLADTHAALARRGVLPGAAR